MANTTRTYGDACRIAHGLDLVGDRWSLLVVRELLLGPKRFTDLSDGLPRATPDMLSRRLRDLAAGGVVERRRLDAPYSAYVYELTDYGARLEPLIIGLGEWAARSEIAPRDPGAMSPDSLVLALRTHFDPTAAKGASISAELRIGDARYSLAVTNGEFEAASGAPDHPDVVIAAKTLPLADALWDEGSLSMARRAGDVRIEGDEKAGLRLLGMFPPLEPFDEDEAVGSRKR